MNGDETRTAFREAGKRAEGEKADEFLSRFGLDGDAFVEEVRHYCNGIDVAGTAGDIAVGFHLARVLAGEDAPPTPTLTIRRVK